MFFSSQKEVVEEGDTVIFYISPNDQSPLIVTAGSILQHRLGRFRHSSLIGQKYGSKWTSDDGQKFATILRPTAELWTRSLPHRTQILYLPDSSFIIRQLRISSESIVFESGTGSGSFSHVLARTIYPNGRLLTFEFHPERAEMARKEFLEHGLQNIVTIEHRDVIERGFGRVDEADAIFLDLPAPWAAITWAKQSLKKNGQSRIACFSPCIEQVLKTLDALRQQGFADIRMFEVLSRDYELRALDSSGSINTQSLKKRHIDENACNGIVARPVVEARGHTSYLTFARLSLLSVKK